MPHNAGDSGQKTVYPEPEAVVNDAIARLNDLNLTAPPYINSLVNLTGRDVAVALLTPSDEPAKAVLLPAHAAGAARLVCTITPGLLKTMPVRPEYIDDDDDDDDDEGEPRSYNAPVYNQPDEHDEYDNARIRLDLPKGLDVSGCTGVIVPLAVAMHLASTNEERVGRGRKPVPVYVAIPVIEDKIDVLIQWRATL